MKHSKKCPQLHKIKEQLNNGKSHYGQWTWSMDMTWMDDKLMMDWLMDGCFPLLYLLTYLYMGKMLENSRILFFRKNYNPSYNQYTLGIILASYTIADYLQTMLTHALHSHTSCTVISSGHCYVPGTRRGCTCSRGCSETCEAVGLDGPVSPQRSPSNLFS